MIYDIIGEIRVGTSVILTSEDGFEYEETEVLKDDNGNPFYHVNMINPDMSLVGDYIVEVDTPNRVFAGDVEFVCLKFTDRSEWLALGIEVEEDYE